MKYFAAFVSLFALTCLLALAVDQAPPAAGSPAPAFSLASQEGAQVSLDQLKGKWVVLYFYPKDFTSGCTVEAHNFQRDIDKYTQKNAVIVGVSVDNVDSHKGFCAKEGLNFKLLADPDHAVVQKYDPAGVIRKVYLKVNPQGHSEEVLADLDQLEAAK
jgi:thioredoxin-dependent peroxiredoxin